jgi:hypothetical protein
MKKPALLILLFLFTSTATADFNTDVAAAEANFSVGNYMLALQFYRRAYKQNPDAQVAKYIAFIEMKLKNNPSLIKKKKNPLTLAVIKKTAPVAAAENDLDIQQTTVDTKPDYKPKNPEKPWANADNLASFTVYFGNYQSPSFLVRYERVLFPSGSISAKIGLNSYFFNSSTWQGLGGGLDYRHFFQGKAPNGFFAGAGAEVSSITNISVMIFFLNPAHAMAYQATLFAGYRWIFDFGISFDTSIGLGYVIPGTAPDSLGNKYNYGGFTPSLASNIGYAW